MFTFYDWVVFIGLFTAVTAPTVLYTLYCIQEDKKKASGFE